MNVLAHLVRAARKRAFAGRSAFAVALLAALVPAQDVVLFPQPLTHGEIGPDVNGDGLPDAVNHHYEGEPESGLALRLGRGNGTFAPPLGIPGNHAFALIMGDVTGDGLQDVVTLRALPPGDSVHALDLYAGTGESLASPVESVIPLNNHFAGFSPEQLLADMDGDGLLDWVAATPTNVVTTWLTTVALADGGGSFHVAGQTSAPGAITGLAAGDFDGDGTLDVATSEYDGPDVDVRLGTGGGAFSATPISTPLPASPEAPPLAPAIVSNDLDGDGCTDLVAVFGLAVTDFSAVLALLHGQADGHFATGLVSPLVDDGQPILGDVNADGLGDIVVVHSGLFGVQPAGVSAFLADGFGGLQPPVLSTTAPVYLQETGRVQELDGDGVMDLNLGSVILVGRGDGSFVAPIPLAIDTAQQFGPQGLAAADMNLDGVPDLVTTTLEAGKGVVVLLGHGAGLFDLDVVPVAGSQRLAAGDLDGDGDPDLVAGPFQTGAHGAALFNDGSGISFPISMPVLDFKPADIALADADADGDLDLLASRAPAQDLVLQRNDGGGTLQPQEVIAVGGAAVNIATADLGGDGLPDIAVSLAGEHALATVAGLGGGFAAPQEIAVPDEAAPLLLADLDGSGTIDIAFGAKKFGRVWVLLAQTPEVFGPAAASTLLTAPSDLLAGDLDRDGRTDLVTIDDTGALCFFRNAGAGAFAAAVETWVDHDGVKVAALADFDGNRRLDIAVATDSGVIEVFPNLLPEFPNLGYQHGAGFGTPHLAATGAPVPDTKVSFLATGAPAATPGLLFLGLAFAPQSFAGGTLVPSPDVAVPMQSGVPLSGRWPALPGGTQVYAQAWFAAGGEIAATNALMAVSAPP